jgi:phospholipid/cholesterol/gamma-HCH transport system substrate-binding protein
MRRRILAAAVVLVLAGAGAAVVFGRHVPTHRLVAHFTSAVGISAGSDVRVLGVPIGRVTKVQPQGTSVRVEMDYDAGQPVPAGVDAVVIPPSVVSDRYVQLTPAYAGGPVLADHADLPVARTAVPLELDDVYRALDQFNTALGPGGANKNGALSRAIGTGAANLAGNGQNLHDTLDGASRTLRTLADGRDDLFGTVADLQQFVTMLAESDELVRQFNDRLADAGEQLAGEGPDLAATLRSLSVALSQVATFVHENRDLLTTDVGALTDVTNVLVRQQQALTEVIDVAPLTLSNLNLVYDPRAGTLDTRDDLLGPGGPAGYVCSLMAGLVPVAQIPAVCKALAHQLEKDGQSVPDPLRKLIGLPPAPVRKPAATSPGLNPPGISIDPTLGGILAGPTS